MLGPVSTVIVVPVGEQNDLPPNPNLLGVNPLFKKKKNPTASDSVVYFSIQNTNGEDSLDPEDPSWGRFLWVPLHSLLPTVLAPGPALEPSPSRLAPNNSN